MPKKPKPVDEKLAEKLEYIKSNREFLLTELHSTIADLKKTSFAIPKCIAIDFSYYKNIKPLPGRDCWEAEDIDFLMANIFTRR